MRAPLRAVAVLAGLGFATATFTACNTDTVTLSYRPGAGATFEYVATVTTSTTTVLEGQDPSTDNSTAELRSTQEVVDSNADQTRVRISLRRGSGAARTYVARFDRAAQLTSIDQVEDIPAEALGELGLGDIFPAAAGAPPDRRLRPGDRWTIDERLLLPGETGEVRLRGEGRVVELGVIDGRPTAKVTSETTLPLTTSSTSAAGVQMLGGTQTTKLDAHYDVDDGSIVRASAVTTGDFDVVLSPPAGQSSRPITGHLTVRVTTVTRRT